MAGVRMTTPRFKPVPGGYVFRVGSPWLFGRMRFYVVNEAQRAELESILTARGIHRARGYILLISLVVLVSAATMIVGYVSGQREPTALDAAILFGLLPFYVYGAFVLAKLPMARRLKPLIARLPTHPPVSILDWGRPYRRPAANGKLEP